MRQVFVLSLLIATYLVGFIPFDSLAAEPKLTKPERVGIVHTQLLPLGTYPTEPLMKLTTYQSLID